MLYCPANHGQEFPGFKFLSSKFQDKHRTWCWKLETGNSKRGVQLELELEL